MYPIIWSCFAAQEPSSLANLFSDVLEQMGYSYKVTKGMPRFLLDAENPSIIFTIETPNEFQCKIFHASNDPLARFFTRVFSTRRSIDTISFLELGPINKLNKIKISSLLQKIVQHSDKDPWSIDHPRFKLSWALRWRNKNKWLRYLSY